jgi:hypothetical protein
MDWWMDLLTTYTHHSELWVITALSLSFTLYKSLHAKSFPSLLCLQQQLPSNSLQQWRFFSFLHSHCYCLANIPQLNSASLGSSPGPNRKHRLQQFFYCCYVRLPSNSLDIVSAGTCLLSHCSETATCLFAYCIAISVLVVCFEVFV